VPLGSYPDTSDNPARAGSRHRSADERVDNRTGARLSEAGRVDTGWPGARREMTH